MNRMSAALAAALVAFGLAAPAAAQTNTPGTYSETIRVDGMDREFIVHVGRSVPANAAVPVVFMFHGTSGDGQRFLQISGWRQKADQQGFIAVFPSALTYCFFDDENFDGDFNDANERQVTTKWAAGNLGDPAVMPLCAEQAIRQLPLAARNLLDHRVMDDIAFVDAIIDHLNTDFRIDERRIYGSGFSNGAQFTARLMVERSEVFAALAVHAGNLAVPVAPARPMPVILSVGSTDQRFMARTGVELPVDGTAFTGVPGLYDTIVLPFVEQLGLAGTHVHAAQTVNLTTVSTYTFGNSLVGAANTFTFAVIDNNDHNYPNGINHPVVMVDLLWRFFEPLSLP